MGGLVLSLFPGIGLLDRAFEAEGFCIVRGPDLLWGGDVRSFHPPAGTFDGIIGGPPCQRFSPLAQASRKGLQPLADDLIPEYVRCIEETQPRWWLSENVPEAPVPSPAGYARHEQIIDAREVGSEQHRVRRFCFGSRAGLRLAVEPQHRQSYRTIPCVTANGMQWERDGSGGRSRSDRSRPALRRYIEAQGLPAEFERLLCHPKKGPFTIAGAVRVIGNGVPVPLGRAVARAVRRALESADLEAA